MKNIPLCIFLVILSATAVFAQQPQTYPYEGNLTEDWGRPVYEGLHNIIVLIFNNRGDVIWEEMHERIAVRDGRFTIRIGANHPLELPEGQEFQIGFRIDDEEDPRRRTWRPRRGEQPVMDVAPVTQLDRQDRITDIHLPPGQVRAGDIYIRRHRADTTAATINQPVLIVANLGNGNGLVGRAEYGNGLAARSKHNHGVYGRTDKAMGETSGVYGYSGSGTGVTGRSEKYNGVKALTKSDNHAAIAAGNEGKGVALYAHGGSNGLAAIFSGNVQIRSPKTGGTILELGEGLDYAEGFNSSGEITPQPGMVCSIDPDNPGRLMICREAYDHKVAGIVAGANGLGSGVRLGHRSDIDVALAGRVYCFVEAGDRDIMPGDLLTTSETPGHAMAAQDADKARGAVLGKAMEGLKAGSTGLILILVTLQ